MNTTPLTPLTSQQTLEPDLLVSPDPLHVARGEARRRFLEAVDAAQRDEVERLLTAANSGGRGLRAWLNAIVSGRAEMPASISVEVVQVYLDHPEALPLHDCGSCGFLVPVIPGSEYGFEGEPEKTFFPACPNCGGRTGWYLYWAHAERR